MGGAAGRVGRWSRRLDIAAVGALVDGVGGGAPLDLDVRVRGMHGPAELKDSLGVFAVGPVDLEGSLAFQSAGAEEVGVHAAGFFDHVGNLADFGDGVGDDGARTFRSSPG